MKGKKTGGRQLGTRNRRTAAQAAAIAASGETPLEYLLAIMRDETNDLDVRLEAARAALPFCHARLATIEIQAEVTARYDVTDDPLSEDEWASVHASH